MNRNGKPGFKKLLNELLAATWYAATPQSTRYDGLQQQTNLLVLNALMRLAVDTSADQTVLADTLQAIEKIHAVTDASPQLNPELRGFFRLARNSIERMWADPASVESLPAVTVPPGSPIGAATIEH